MKYKSGDEFVKNLVSEYCPEPTISSNIRLETYYKKAHGIFNHALDFVKQANDARSYIELMRYCQLITTLTTHSSYNDTEYISDKKLNKKRLLKAITKLETLKPKLIKAYDEEIEKEKQRLEKEALEPEESPEQQQEEVQEVKEQQQEQVEQKDEIKEQNNSKDIMNASRWNNLKIESSPNYKKQTKNNRKSTKKINKEPTNNLGGIFMDKLPTITPIIMTENLVTDFIKYCQVNTKRDIETCGILTGKYLHEKDAYIITHVIIPKQKGSANTVQTVNEEELIGIQMKFELITLGWIHTHPSQTCFLSSVDLHCQLSYQIMMPNAIAIVHAPKDKTETFILTQKGINVLSKCSSEGFHKHDQDYGLYHKANHIQSAKHQKCKFIDLRK